jgi:anti-sigma regulatory factor (Ser/Thr protein kinase)
MRARGMLNGWLSEQVGDEAAEAIRLATTELVSNAVRHGDPSDDDEITLTVDLVDDVVRVDVEQPTSAAAARVLEPDAQREGGLGLVIVEAFAERWGVTDGTPGHVWFEVRGSL